MTAARQQGSGEQLDRVQTTQKYVADYLVQAM